MSFKKCGVCGHCIWQQLKIDGHGTQTRGIEETCPTSSLMIFRQEIQAPVKWPGSALLLVLCET